MSSGRILYGFCNQRVYHHVNEKSFYWTYI